MEVEVRLSLVNLSFRRHVKAKYHPDQSFSSSFPCWVGLKLYKVDPFRWLLGRTLTFLHRRPAVPCCFKENYSQNNKLMSCCRNVTSFRSVFAIGYRQKNVGSFRKYLAHMWKTSITFAEMYAIFFSQFMNQH